MRLRTLTEAECYARIYGGHGDERVSFVRLLPRRGKRSSRPESTCVEGSRSASTCAVPRRKRHDPDLQDVERTPRRSRSRSAAGPRPRFRARGYAQPPGRSACHAVDRVAESYPHPSSVPDVLAPGLTCVFCGINPGRVSEAAAAHFANPRNDFWRLLHDAGFTPRLYEPQEQFELLELGYGLTNAAYRTTPGSGDLRRGDFDADAFETGSWRVRPRAVAFVGKEAYRGSLRDRPELGPQLHTIGRRAVRAAVDVAGERCGAVPRAPGLVPLAARMARAGGARCRAGARPRRGRAACCSSDSGARPRRVVVGDAGRRHRAGGEPRAGVAPRAPGEIGLQELELGPLLFEQRRSSRGRSGSTGSETRLSRARRGARADGDGRSRGGRSGELRWWTLASSPLRGSSSRRPTSLERVRNLARDRGPRHRPPAGRRRSGSAARPRSCSWACRRSGRSRASRVGAR